MPAPQKSKLHCLPIPTPDGEFVALYSPLGLAELHFPAQAKPPKSTASAALPKQIPAWHRLTTAAVKKILAGQPPGALPPLDVSRGSDFQQRVWRALLGIKSGQTQSYGAIAKSIGSPQAGRAVGGACGANPIPLLVPCHRVLAANQKIGGFSGGLGWKKKLLAREGVALGQ